MTAEETEFLRDLRRVMREHDVELKSDFAGGYYLCDRDCIIDLSVDDNLVWELRDQGGNRDEV